MDVYQKEFLGILEESSSKCTSNNIALSGGLDSSAIAYCIRDKRPDAYTVIAEDFVGTDLTYSQMVSSRLGMRQHLMKMDTAQLITGIEETARILGNFNDIEIRNSLVMYLTLDALKKRGETDIITGDGADELFAGYDFMLKKSGQELEEDLERIAGIMHFPSKRIGDALGVSVEAPFLDERMVEFAKGLPARQKVGVHDGKRFGKMIIRDSMRGKVPNQIVWREKAPMQDGSGTSGLTEMFDILVTDDAFEQKRVEILREDGVSIRTKESMQYYQMFRRHHPSPNSGQAENACPDCRHAVETNTKFCRMCGRFPL